MSRSTSRRLSTPQFQGERPMDSLERQRMVKRARAAFLDADVTMERWEAVYPPPIREEAKAGLFPDDIRRMAKLRGGGSRRV